MKQIYIIRICRIIKLDPRLEAVNIVVFGGASPREFVPRRRYPQEESTPKVMSPILY